MAFYFKGNKKVFAMLGCADGDKIQTKDGSYVFFRSDAIALAQKINYEDLIVDLADSFNKFMTVIGGLMLDSNTARLEQQGKSAVPLPKATDPRFLLDGQTLDEDSTDTEVGIHEDELQETQEDEV
jgi:hypothetical protein